MPSHSRPIRRALTGLALVACAPAAAEPVDPDHPSSTPPPTVAPDIGCDTDGCVFGTPQGVVHDGYRYWASTSPEPASVGWWEHVTYQPSGTYVRAQLCNGTIPFHDGECGPASAVHRVLEPDPWGATGSVNGYPCGGLLPTCRVLACESGGDPTAQNPTSSASGLWQVLRSTWAGYGGYSEAWHAPPDVQNAKAAALWDGGAGRSHWRSCL